MLSKEDFPKIIKTPRTVVRKAIPEDFPHIWTWPLYDWPWEVFNQTDRKRSSEENILWWEQIEAPNRCHYTVVLSDSNDIIGIYAFTNINWQNAFVGNMGIRIRADFCGQGYGTETLKPLLSAVLAGGIRKIRLDVAATNEWAIRCYQKCGFRITGEEHWREHSGNSVEPSDPKWQPLLPHLKQSNEKWLCRHMWFEVTSR